MTEATTAEAAASAAAPPVHLRGITWNHTRGFVSMVASAQRFEELHPGVRISWEKRSLQDFADQSIAALSQRYDLLVVDHPSVGEAAEHGLFLPLDEHLPASFLDDQARHSVGHSHLSYRWNKHQWGLATDAATPVSAWRPDLLDALGESLPSTWEELIALAERGRVAFAGLGLDCLMYWYCLCLAEGQAPFLAPRGIVAEEVGVAALRSLQQLARACGTMWLGRNPISVLEAMTQQDRWVYQPMCYGYANYATPGYAQHCLRFGGLVTYRGKGQAQAAVLRSTLGGAGLALSARLASKQSHQALQAALDFAQFVASPAVQTGIYTLAGGQPGHRQAWLDEANNARQHHYFHDTLPTLDRAYLRPRYAGYIGFQEQAPNVVRRFLQGELDERATLTQLNALDWQYRQGRDSGAEGSAHP